MVYALICSAQATSVLVALDDSMSSCRMQQDDHDIAQERTLLFGVVAREVGVANCDACLLHIAPAIHGVWSVEAGSEELRDCLCSTLFLWVPVDPIRILSLVQLVRRGELFRLPAKVADGLVRVRGSLFES